MRALLRYARIAPKKANLVAALVRRQSVDTALSLLSRLPKKGARLLHALIVSAAANAEHNAKQEQGSLFIKQLTVQKGTSFRRSIPMARGRARPIEKATSHLAVELGVLVPKRPAAKVTQQERKEEKEEEVQHVDSLPVSGPVEEKKHVVLEDPHSKGFSPKHGPKGPTFQPHQRGARGA